MSEKTNIAKRAVQAAAFTVGGGVALTFAMAGSAHADEIAVQNSNVTNAGASAANSGGNVAVGNASTNVAANGQAAFGGLASNTGTASNSSDGTATITTGAATAVGDQSTTTVAQQVAAPADDPGVVVAVQNSNVVNAGASFSNTGGNVAVGNASTNIAANGQLAAGGIASNTGTASNKSDGTATITTGAATTVGNLSDTNVKQADTGGSDGGVLDLLVQNTDVLNLGVAVANTGGNIAVGNASFNLAANGQGAFGLIAASNGGSANNDSDGTATITTGAATTVGNKSKTTVDQGVDEDPAGLALVLQNAPVVNAGLGIANTGLNAGAGNHSTNVDLLAQISFGLLSTNTTGGTGNVSDGFAAILTGVGTATGNDSTNAITQKS